MALLSFRSLVLSTLVLGAFLVKQGECHPANEADDDLAYNNDEYNNYDDEDDSGGADETYTGPPPVVKSPRLELEVDPGSTVVLPCEVEHATYFAIIWKNGSSMLFTSHIPMSHDPRLTQFPNNSLKITNFGHQDSGDYECSVTSEPVVKVVHRVVTKRGPDPDRARILRITPQGSAVVKKGSTVTLTCEVGGNPMPKVTWTRKNSDMPNKKDHVEGEIVTFNMVDRHYTGEYQCEADNGKGEPARASVGLIVHYAPEVHAEHTEVTSGEEYESDLACTVHANPRAEVTWLKDGHVINKDSHVRSSHKGAKYMLHIAKTKKEDFGKYTCIANNTLGTKSQVIKLTGLPSTATFVGESPSADGASHELEWSVKSYAPIVEYKLQYKKTDSDTWQEQSPVVVNPEGNMYTVKHKLSGLPPGQYEVILSSRSTFGWSEDSRPHTFSAEFLNGEAAAKTSSIEDSKGPSSAEDTRPRLLALMTILSLSAFFL